MDSHWAFGAERASVAKPLWKVLASSLPPTALPARHYFSSAGRSSIGSAGSDKDVGSAMSSIVHSSPTAGQGSEEVCDVLSREPATASALVNTGS